MLASYTRLYTRQWTRMTDSRHAPNPRKHYVEKAPVWGSFFMAGKRSPGRMGERGKECLTQRTHKYLKTNTNLGNEPNRTHAANPADGTKLLNIKRKAGILASCRVSCLDSIACKELAVGLPKSGIKTGAKNHLPTRGLASRFPATRLAAGGRPARLAQELVARSEVPG